jgi:hypothetical protein
MPRSPAISLSFMSGVCLTLCAISPGFAQAPASPAVPKSDYSIFNPTPADRLRPFTAERPSKVATPGTIDAGKFQVESELINYTYDAWSPGGTTTKTTVYFAPTLKIGITDRTELDIITAPFNRVRTTNRSDGSSTRFSGFGDITARVKVNVWGNEGDMDTSFAIIPFVKFPTAEKGFGNNRVEGGLQAPISFALPWSMTLIYQPEVDYLSDAVGNDRHFSIINVLNLSRPMIPDVLTGIVELWSNADLQTKGRTQYTLDFALAWAVMEDTQLDVGINLGLNRAAPDYQPYIGIAYRF